MSTVPAVVSETSSLSLTVAPQPSGVPLAPLLGWGCAAALATGLVTAPLRLDADTALGTVLASALLAVLVAGVKRHRMHGLVAIMMVLGALVAWRWQQALALWAAPVLAAPAAGAVMALYGWAGWTAVVPAGAPGVVLNGRWALVVGNAQSAHAQLAQEVREGSSAKEMAGLLRSSASLLGVIEQSAGAWSRLERGASPQAEAAIRAQVERVQGRMGADADPVASHEWQRTLEALGQQLDHVERIRRGGDRALARLECQVTQMETARLSLLAYAAQDTGVRAMEAARLSTLLEDARAELTVTAEAMEDAQSAALPAP